MIYFTGPDKEKRTIVIIEHEIEWLIELHRTIARIQVESKMYEE
jgi:hypothetical protein